MNLKNISCKGSLYLGKAFRWIGFPPPHLIVHRTNTSNQLLTKKCTTRCKGSAQDTRWYLNRFLLVSMNNYHKVVALSKINFLLWFQQIWSPEGQTYTKLWMYVGNFWHLCQNSHQSSLLWFAWYACYWKVPLTSFKQ